ncbi:deaminase [Geodermatophilaceae bacterium NBWT11]|nr:deaminase [Geodermatophilaceae bacterium NBWT11]
MRALLPPAAGLLDAATLAETYRPPPGRHVRAGFVAALDGATSVDGLSSGLGSAADKAVFRVLRAWADAVLVGRGTAAAEGYRPLTPDSPVGRIRAELGRSATAPVVVVSRHASLLPTDRLVTDAVSPTHLVTCAASDPGRRAVLTAAGVQVLVCGDDDVDLPAALDALAERGLTHVLCEGGPTLFGSAVAAGVVDELCLTIAPLLVGGAPGLLGGHGLPDPARAQLIHLLEEDGAVFGRYVLNS